MSGAPRSYEIPGPFLEHPQYPGGHLSTDPFNWIDTGPANWRGRMFGSDWASPSPAEMLGPALRVL